MSIICCVFIPIKIVYIKKTLHLTLICHPLKIVDNNIISLEVIEAFWHKNWAVKMFFIREMLSLSMYIT